MLAPQAVRGLGRSLRHARCQCTAAATTQPKDGLKAACLIIGDEILRGNVQDSNTHALATRLYRRGVDLVRAEVCSDEEADIAESLLGLKRRVGPGGVIFTAGGIGTTHDDRTYAAVARAFGVGLELHQETLRRMTEDYQRRGIEVNTARERMATIPQGSEVLFSPGLWVPLVNCNGVYILPGIPRLFTAMLDAHIGRFTGPAFLSATLYTQEGEGSYADALRAIAAEHPGVSIGSYPNVSPEPAVQAAYKGRLIVGGRDQGLVDAALASIRGALRVSDTPPFGA